MNLKIHFNCPINSLVLKLETTYIMLKVILEPFFSISKRTFPVADSCFYLKNNVSSHIFLIKKIINMRTPEPFFRMY